MKYLLKEVDELVQSCLTSSGFGLTVPVELNVCLLALKTEAKKFKYEISSNFSFLEDETVRKKMVQKHLSRLVFLSDSLYQDVQRVSKEKVQEVRHWLVLCIQIIDILEKLQQFLLKEFSAYCNMRQSVSYYAQQKTIKYFRRNLSKLSEQNNTPDKELTEIAIYPFKILIRKNKPRLSFTTKQYILRLFKILLLYVYEPLEQAENRKSLSETLFAINFNSIHYLNYYTKQIEEDIQKIDSLKDRIERLYYHLKMVNQQLIDASACFNTKLENVKEFVSAWILEEICFLEKRLFLQSNSGTDQQLIDQNFKIVTELSVAQVACFIRLLVEAGVIKNKNRKELIAFYAVYTQSKKQENISPESFRMRFYNIEDSARREIRDIIIQLLNLSNRL